MRAVPDGDLMKPSRKTNGVGVQAEDTRICVVMVGLPARGKSLIAQKGTLTSNLNTSKLTWQQSSAISTGFL
jgi:hypothetical protein